MIPKIEEVWDIPFYKYVSIDDAKLILSKSDLKFNNPSKFNDPFDCNDLLIRIDLDFSRKKELLKEMVYKGFTNLDREGKRKKLNEFKFHPEKLRELVIKQISFEKEKIGICCFSKVNDDILLWSHYADKHKGVCINFKFIPVYVKLCAFYPVNYVEKIEQISSSELMTDVMFHWLLTKSKKWEYEQEIRSIAMEYKGFINFDKQTVQEIIFGCNTSKDDINEITKILKEKGYPENIVLNKMKIDKETFGLKPVLIKQF